MKWEIYLGAAIALIIVGALVIVGVEHWGNGRYDAGHDAGRNEVLASYAQTAKQYQQAQDALDKYAAAAGQALNQTLGAALPTIQGNTHESVETIRTVYVHDPVPAASCGRPAGVQDALDAAVERANAAVKAASGGLRSDPAAGSSSASPAAGDDRGHAGQR